MATIVCFHAHPDDEAIATGGGMARAAAEGHRVVLVTATRGEHGEVQPGLLADGEALWERRVRELAEACRVLGVSHQVFLGYVDSGMMGTPENDAAGSFWQADPDEAATRLAAILRQEDADVLTIYDANGVYGHPDHIQVHRVGVRAADQAGTPRVYEATIDIDRVRAHMVQLAELAEQGGEPAVAMAELLDGPSALTGSPASAITTRVDVRPWVEAKRRALAAHASQVGPDSWFLSLPHAAFEMAFGEEDFIRRGAPDGLLEDDLLAGIG